MSQGVLMHGEVFFATSLLQAKHAHCYYFVFAVGADLRAQWVLCKAQLL